MSGDGKIVDLKKRSGLFLVRSGMYPICTKLSS
jgi:hypothetical protein